MVCPKCKSSNVTVSAINEVKEKRKKGLLYWIFIGWWQELFAWIFLTLPKLIFALFGRHKKIVSKTVTYAVCQNCGHRWKA